MPMLRTVTVIKRHFPMVFDKKSKATIGQLVDMRLREMIEQGEEVQTIAVEFDESDADKLRGPQTVEWDTKL